MSRIVDYWSACTDYLCRHIDDETYVDMDGCIIYGPHNIEMCIAHARYVIDSTVSGRHHIEIGFCDRLPKAPYFVRNLDWHVMFACDFIGGI